MPPTTFVTFYPLSENFAMEMIDREPSQILGSSEDESVREAKPIDLHPFILQFSSSSFLVPMVIATPQTKYQGANIDSRISSFTEQGFISRASSFQVIFFFFRSDSASVSETDMY